MYQARARLAQGSVLACDLVFVPVSLCLYSGKQCVQWLPAALRLSLFAHVSAGKQSAKDVMQHPWFVEGLPLEALTMNDKLLSMPQDTKVRIDVQSHRMLIAEAQHLLK